MAVVRTPVLAPEQQRHCACILLPHDRSGTAARSLEGPQAYRLGPASTTTTEGLQNEPRPLVLEKDKDSRLLTSPLKFPGKLAIDVQNNQLFISDSNHNRIVVTNMEGPIICQFDSSEEGLLDGPFDAALLNRP